jgi:hypothetical protein
LKAFQEAEKGTEVCGSWRSGWKTALHSVPQLVLLINNNNNNKLHGDLREQVYQP